ncbi:MAG: hypothetical protein ONB46_10360 [candidate division KSB1 bacterium]|nr:hypothetical protein [candidate division KSB1 bacterium]MDZ7366207.1 hypothetical protein [candidate division KSB1 bacterium]MDZ7404425.1 hypothetical protein [candidate division KSB1 bacterium]
MSELFAACHARIMSGRRDWCRQAFGLSRSNISRRFIRTSAKKLQTLLERHLEQYAFVALVLDGKTCRQAQRVMVLRITKSGNRLGLFKELGGSLKTTNSLESINAQVERMTREVTRWRNSDQRQRWLASALLEIGPRLRKIKGYRYLPQRQQAWQRALKIQTPGRVDRL